MDPNATLRLIAECLEDRDYGSALESCFDLKRWIANGGFQPEWDAYPAASAYFVVNCS